MSIRRGATLAVTPLLIGALFAYLLSTHFYVYLVYLLLGVFYYLLVRRFGREMSFLFLIPIVTVALVLVGQIFLLDFYDHNGLNPIKIHPLVLSLLVLVYLTLLEDVLRGKFVWDRVAKLTVAIFVVFLGITLWKRGLSGVSYFNQNYLGPLSFFYFIYSQKKYDLHKLRLFTNVLIVVMVLMGIWGVVEYINQATPLQTIYDTETPTWIEGSYHEGYRIKTSIGHPLDNAIMFLFAMILVQTNIRNAYLKYGILLLFMVDLLASGSRSIFLLSFFVLLYNNSIKETGWAFFKKYLYFLVPAVLLVLGMLFSPLGQTIINRFNNAGESTQARFLFINYFLHHLFSFQMLGLGGATSTIALYNSRYEKVYLENPWIILFFEVSYFILLFLAYLYVVIRRVDFKYFVIIMLIALSAMNSFGVKTIDIYALFYLLAYFFAHRQARLGSKSSPPEYERIAGG
ncbi:hypothetical protein [Cohnella sp. AR92]|uniref:hypothetical protein n=1 Tax=Cohnella sp. AR92 TaxID=648716 RepID=UPI001863AD5D|nr:hypothetical protein [Cohnella sp. AR92]